MDIKLLQEYLLKKIIHWMFKNQLVVCLQVYFYILFFCPVDLFGYPSPDKMSWLMCLYREVLQSGRVVLLILFFLKIALATLVSWLFHVEFKVSMSVCQEKKLCWTLMGIALNSEINLGGSDNSLCWVFQSKNTTVFSIYVGLRLVSSMFSSFQHTSLMSCWIYTFHFSLKWL